MSDHRIRLSSEDIALIIRALTCRLAMTSGLRRHRVERLRARLFECTPGNPKLILDEFSQTHEEDLSADDTDVPSDLPLRLHPVQVQCHAGFEKDNNE
jgi:hypothetical protein